MLVASVSVDEEHSIPQSRYVHRLAVLAVCLIWPLIWVGGLVTTYDAGMAVPDWPTTYGDNLFLYPYTTWLAGPFDLFIEHGHRLLGAVVGFVSIGLLVAAWGTEKRKWVIGFAVVILMAVCFQGGLGGIRVVRASRTLAMIHGCFGPAFFAICVAFAVVTSQRWFSAAKRIGVTKLKRSHVWITGSLVAVSYLQLVLGAQLRHTHPDTEPGGFALMVAFHVMTAFLLWGLTLVGWIKLRHCGDLTLSRNAFWLIGLVVLQILLGVGTWAANYGWPTILSNISGSERFLVHDKGFWESVVITGHVATGSLILAISTMIWVRCWRDRHVSLVHQAANTPPSETSSAGPAVAATT